MSILPTFYEQIFCTKAFFAPFLYLLLQFRFVWRKKIDAKVALKINNDEIEADH